MAQGELRKSKAAKERDGDHVPQNPEPALVTKLPCPKWMPKYGKALWEDLAPKLIKERVLTEWDYPSFEILCREYSTYREVVDVITKDGNFVGTAAGTKKKHPGHDIMSKSATTFAKFAEKFGLSIIDRKRMDISLADPKTQKSKYSTLGNKKT